MGWFSSASWLCGLINVFALLRYSNLGEHKSNARLQAVSQKIQHSGKITPAAVMASCLLFVSGDDIITAVCPLLLRLRRHLFNTENKEQSFTQSTRTRTNSDMTHVYLCTPTTSSSSSLFTLPSSPLTLVFLSSSPPPMPCSDTITWFVILLQPSLSVAVKETTQSTVKLVSQGARRTDRVTLIRRAIPLHSPVHLPCSFQHLRSISTNYMPFNYYGVGAPLFIS